MRFHHIRHLLVLGAAFGGAVACTDPGTSRTVGSEPQMGAPADVPADSTGEVVRYRAIGGNCLYARCSPDLRIARDGSWTMTRGVPITAGSGRLDGATSTELNAKVDGGIDGLASLPTRDGRCPVALGASEIVISVTGGGRTVTVSNCTAIFGEDELVAYVRSLASQINV
jgi:hypothetical protein